MPQDCGGKVGAGDMRPKIAGVKWGQETCGPSSQDCRGKVGAGDMWPKIAGGKVGAGDMWPKIAGVKLSGLQSDSLVFFASNLVKEIIIDEWTVKMPPKIFLKKFPNQLGDDC